MRVTYNAAPGSLFGRWRFMQEIGCVLICYYFPAGSEGEGHTYIAFRSDSQQWKQGITVTSLLNNFWTGTLEGLLKTPQSRDFKCKVPQPGFLLVVVC